MTTTDPLPRLLTIEELADHLGVTVRHVRRLIAENRVPYVKWRHFIQLRSRRDRPLARRRPPPSTAQTMAVLPESLRPRVFVEAVYQRSDLVRCSPEEPWRAR
jgi:excisionase family DNA binding protein